MAVVADKAVHLEIPAVSSQKVEPDSVAVQDKAGNCRLDCMEEDLLLHCNDMCHYNYSFYYCIF